MIQDLHFPHGTLLFNNSNPQNLSSTSIKITLENSCFQSGHRTANMEKRRSNVLFPTPVRGLVGKAELSLVEKIFRGLVGKAELSLVEKGAICDAGQFTAFPHIRFLRNLPKKDLFNKVVMVRFDAMVLLQGMKEHQPLPADAFSTIKYLYEAGAKVVLVSSWNKNMNSWFHSEACPSTESSYLQESKQSGILLLENLFHFKGERANCAKFAKELASGVDIIVNDAFSESHKALASTVGVARFGYACMAGFYFEKHLYKLKKIIKAIERPYVAIIGGGNLAEKAAALHFLVSKCDGLIFVGSMAFQILHALGVPVPVKLVDLGALKEAASIVESAKSRNIPLLLPKDIRCIKDHISEKMEIFPVDSMLEGWRPVDIGPRSLGEMINLLSRCKKVMWIGPLRFSSQKQDEGGTLKLAEMLGTLSDCDVTFVGKMETDELLGQSKSVSNVKFLKSAAVVWEVLKGRKLPGLMALDRGYPFLEDWSVAYDDPMRPLVVDVGCGNGLFLFGMASKRKEMNFLGLEINAKLVDRCLNDVHRLGIQNVHFISTNATSNFRSVVSGYPRELVLVSIQCPNPDFNKPEYRWRMLRRSLVEAVADMLMFGGMVPNYILHPKLSIDTSHTQGA
ncbi:hypothetical protein OROMI_012153 [Orobanche minor]